MRPAAGDATDCCQAGLGWPHCASWGPRASPRLPRLWPTHSSTTTTRTVSTDSVTIICAAPVSGPGQSVRYELVVYQDMLDMV